jgi:DNA-binding protein HU-beta
MRCPLLLGLAPSRAEDFAPEAATTAAEWWRNGGFPRFSAVGCIDGPEFGCLECHAVRESHPVRHPSVSVPITCKRAVSVNKNDLVAHVADKTDLSKAKAAEVLDTIFAAIEGALKKKQQVRLVGFGTFSVSKRKAGKGRNPRTGEEIKIPASFSVRFKAGKGLKDAVN